jgi:Flp pilus assembly protein TadD
MPESQPATAAVSGSTPALGSLGRGIWLPLTVVVLVFVAYWPALRGEFIWDDVLVVRNNPLLKGELTLRTVWFHTDFPLSTVFFWLQWQVWGAHPAGYHVVNLLLHATSCLLLWRLLLRMKIPGASLAAILFAVHPVCAASVAWIAELKNTLSLPFYLLAFLFYVRFEERAETGARGAVWPWYSAALAAFVLALLSKTTTVMLPPVLLVYLWWRRGRVRASDFVRVAPFFLLAVAFGIFTILFQAHGAMRGATVQTLGFGGRLAGAGMALWFYLGKALFPIHLMMIYPRWQIDAASALAYLPAALWAALLGLTWFFRRGWGRHALLGLGTFSLALFPVLGFFSMYYLALSRVSDHFEYLPLISMVALAAAALHCRVPGKILAGLAPVLIGLLALLTAQRARVYVSEEAFWRDNVRKNPSAWTAHANLGWIMASQQKYGDAMEHLRKSLAINPDNAQARANLGQLLAMQGSFGDAEAQFAAARKLKPDDAEIGRSYAGALAENGRKDEAARELRRLLEHRADAETRLQLAGLLFETGQFGEAIPQYREALAARPDEPEALSNLAWLLATSNDASLRNGTNAVSFALRACKLTSFKQAPMVGVLAAAYAEAGDFTNATATARQAIDLAVAAGDRGFAAQNYQLLQLYKSSRAYHATPAAPVAK